MKLTDDISIIRRQSYEVGFCNVGGCRHHDAVVCVGLGPLSFRLCPEHERELRSKLKAPRAARARTRRKNNGYQS